MLTSRDWDTYIVGMANYGKKFWFHDYDSNRKSEFEILFYELYLIAGHCDAYL
jgi:hypothetical protein